MKKILSILGLASALVLCGTPPASATSLVFSPQDQTVGLGSSVSVDVKATDLAGQMVGSYDFFVGWDSSILSLASVTYGNANFTGDTAPFVTNMTNPNGLNSEEVLGWATGALLNQNGSTPIDFLTLNFNTLALGTSALTFADGIVSGFDTNGNPIYNGSLGDDSAITQTIAGVNKVQGSITVVQGGPTPGPGPGPAVPEPSIILLFGAGFMGWTISRRRGGTPI